MLLEVEGLTKEFGGLRAVNDVSFSAGAGEVVGLIGPNGAGKTTLFHCISGFLMPTRGHISFDGANVVGLRPHALCKLGLARTFQIAKPFPELSVLNTVAVAVHNRVADARDADEEASRILGFVGFRAPVETLGKNLSVVNRKRLEVARALATRPRMLLLDEVCAGLNPTEVREAVKLIEKIGAQGISVIMVEHVMQAVMSVASRVVVLDYGRKIAEGKPTEVVSNPAVIEAYLGTKRVAVGPGRE